MRLSRLRSPSSTKRALPRSCVGSWSSSISEPVGSSDRFVIVRLHRRRCSPATARGGSALRRFAMQHLRAQHDQRGQQRHGQGEHARRGRGRRCRAAARRRARCRRPRAGSCARVVKPVRAAMPSASASWSARARSASRRLCRDRAPRAADLGEHVLGGGAAGDVRVGGQQHAVRRAPARARTAGRRAARSRARRAPPTPWPRAAAAAWRAARRRGGRRAPAGWPRRGRRRRP